MKDGTDPLAIVPFPNTNKICPTTWRVNLHGVTTGEGTPQKENITVRRRWRRIGTSARGATLRSARGQDRETENLGDDRSITTLGVVLSIKGRAATTASQVVSTRGPD